jgi:hypothetical protein
MSFYQRRKCSTAQHLPCSPDLGPHEWADNRLTDAIKTVGPEAKARLIATEAGTVNPQTWPAERAFESLGVLMQKHGTAGATFWRWTSYDNGEDFDPLTAKPVKQRGVAYSYFPPKHEIVDLGGFHLAAISNGSFEAGGAQPSKWAIAGNGTGSRYHLAAEAGQPQVPSRGSYSLRLVTGADANAAIRATSVAVAVDPATAYTTTGNLRFAWSGDPNPGGNPAQRPQVFVTVRYLQANGQASAIKPSDTFRFLQENGAADFQTVPVQYQTPADAAAVRIIVGAARNGLPSAITLDVDNMR